MSQGLTIEQRDTVIRRCRKVIDGFEHRDALREDDVGAWLAEVVGTHGEMAVWHATRAGGFGGSDIGVLVKNHADVRADHQASAHDLVAGKLLRIVPSEETSVLRRGHDNEPLHAQRFYAKYGAVRDEQAFELLKSATGIRRWMRYSPDEVALMPAAEPNPHLGGRRQIRVLGDYKAPTVVDDSDAISFQYACQLHQGAMLARSRGLHLDGMLLSQFDWARWELKDDWIQHNADLDQAILAAGDHYWGFVLRGEVPPYVFKKRFEDKEGLAERFAEYGSRIARLKALASAVDKEVKASEAVIRGAFEGHRLSGLNLRVGDLKVSAAIGIDRQKTLAAFSESQLSACVKKGGSKGFDADAMALALKELGVDLRPFRTDPLDADKVYAMAAELNMDADDLMVESLRLVPPEEFKQEAKDLILTAFPPVAEPASAEETAARVAAEAAVAAVAAAAAATTQTASAPPEMGEANEANEDNLALEAAGDLDEMREGASSERQAPRAT